MPLSEIAKNYDIEKALEMLKTAPVSTSKEMRREGCFPPKGNPIPIKEFLKQHGISLDVEPIKTPQKKKKRAQ
jgi:hypothetical protein